MSNSHTIHNPQFQAEAVAELTRALATVIRALSADAPQNISVFFDGTEVYQQRTEDGRVLWWRADDSAPTPHPISLVSSH